MKCPLFTEENREAVFFAVVLAAAAAIQTQTRVFRKL
jgi:hypothetical protein